MMPTIDRKLVLTLKEGVIFYLHLVNGLDLHSVENNYNGIVTEYNFESYISYLIIVFER